MKEYIKKIILFLFYILCGTQYISAQTNFWIQTSAFTDKKISALAFNSNSVIFAATVSDGVYCSSDMGLTWKSLINGLSDKNVTALTINTKDNIFIGTPSGIFRSTDNGENWQYTGCPTMDKTSIAVDSKDIIYLGMKSIGGGGGVYGALLRSNDDGTSWTDTLLQGYVTFVNVNSFGNIFAIYSLSSTIARSTNNGASFQFLTPEDYHGFGNSISFGSGNLVYLAHDLGISLSTNNGNSWTTNNNGLANKYIKAIIVNQHNIVYAVSYYGGGTYYSLNNGDRWIENNTGLTDLNVNCVAIDSNGFIYIGTNSGKVFRSQMSTDSVKPNLNENPLKFNLAQNYPNPFNPTTTIRYQIPQAGIVSLKVYDILGKEVATLINEEKPAGTYNCQFSIDNFQLPSGVYFYRLQSGSFLKTKKLILLK